MNIYSQLRIYGQLVMSRDITYLWVQVRLSELLRKKRGKNIEVETGEGRIWKEYSNGLGVEYNPSITYEILTELEFNDY